MGNNLQLVTEDIAGGLSATLVVDCLDYGGEVILTDLFRAEVPVELSSRRVGVVSAVACICVSLGRVGATLPGDPHIKALIEGTSGQRANCGSPGVHPVLTRAELSVPEEQRAVIVSQHSASVVTADASHSKLVAIGSGHLVGLPQPVEALAGHLQGEGKELFAVGLRGLQFLLDIRCVDRAFSAGAGHQLCALTDRVFRGRVCYRGGGCFTAGRGRG